MNETSQYNIKCTNEIRKYFWIKRSTHIHPCHVLMNMLNTSNNLIGKLSQSKMIFFFFLLSTHKKYGRRMNGELFNLTNTKDTQTLLRNKKFLFYFIFFGRCFLIIDFKFFFVDLSLNGALSRDLFVLADRKNLLNLGWILEIFVEWNCVKVNEICREILRGFLWNEMIERFCDKNDVLSLVAMRSFIRTWRESMM